MIIVIVVRPTLIPNRDWIIVDIRGVATENAVAVPARRAKTATKSTILPTQPSVCFPNNGLHASENLCLFHFLTWSIKPKATASTR